MTIRAQTTVTNDRGDWRITLTSTGQSVLLADVGRCYRLFSDGGSVDIAKVLPWRRMINRVRRWMREGTMPIGDVHAPALYQR